MNIYRPNPGASNSDIRSHGGAGWQRRLLMARGEQLHITSVEDEDRCAIAILDARGIVISWHDTLSHARANDRSVLSRNVSQFYLPDDIALDVPARHLSVAAEYGVDTQRGWRRRPDGEIFWGATIVHGILLSNGEVLGYSHVTRCLHAPAEDLFMTLAGGPSWTASLALTA